MSLSVAPVLLHFEKSKFNIKLPAASDPHIQKHPQRQAKLAWPEGRRNVPGGGGGPASSAFTAAQMKSVKIKVQAGHRKPLFCQAEPLSLFMRCSTLSGNRDLLS